MCGRYLLLSPPEAIRRLFGTSGSLPNFPPRYNAAPTDIMPVVRLHDGARHIDMLRWGLVPSWADGLAVGSRMINARAESIATKAAFRESFERRRCLVPADGYYEWKAAGGRRQAYWLRATEAPVAFAGIWERWRRPHDVTQGSPRDIGPAGEVIETFAIVTAAALPEVANTHHRMPLVMPESDFSGWLDPVSGPAALQSLLAPKHVDLEIVAVGDAVNSVRNDDARCLEPARDAGPVQASLF